jgi:hypothetical protein
MSPTSSQTPLQMSTLHKTLSISQEAQACRAKDPSCTGMDEAISPHRCTTSCCRQLMDTSFRALQAHTRPVPYICTWSRLLRCLWVCECEHLRHHSFEGTTNDTYPVLGHQQQHTCIPGQLPQCSRLKDASSDFGDPGHVVLKSNLFLKTLPRDTSIHNHKSGVKCTHCVTYATHRCLRLMKIPSILQNPPNRLN